MSLSNVSVTRKRDTRIGIAQISISTLARKPPVTLFLILSSYYIVALQLYTFSQLQLCIPQVRRYSRIASYCTTIIRPFAIMCKLCIYEYISAHYRLLYRCSFICLVKS